MSNLLDLLTAGDVDGFNASRGQRRRVDLFAADLAEVVIPGVDLSGANLEKADLTGADLTDANISKTDLSGIDGSGMKLVDAMGLGAKLKEAYLEGADLTGCELSHADLAECVLIKSQGASMRLVNARLREVDATGAVWPDVDLSEAKLHKANFTDADLSRANLTETVANEAIFVRANLEGASGSRAKLQGADFSQARLAGARLEEANFQGANLSGADLSGADLRRANLSGANLTGATLRGAILADAVLEGLDLASLDLTQVDLTGLDPRALGLSEAQLGTLAAVGAPVASDAPLRFADVSVARRGSTVAMLWENHDTEDTMSLRWALAHGKKTSAGVLPLSAEGVLSRSVAQTADGFELLVLQERPGGVSLLRYTLSLAGELGTAKVEPIGYEPGVVPVVRVEDGTTWVWGLARRGPTLVVQKIGGEGLETVHSEKYATARGFLGRHSPVLACKGGVVMPITKKGAGEPLRTPSQFPPAGRLAVAVALADKVLALWVEARKGEDEPGGIRCAWMGKGVTPKVEVLSTDEHVTSLDALAHGDAVHVAWTEHGGMGAGSVWLASLPEGEPHKLTMNADLDIEEVRFSAEAGDEPSEPLLALTTFDEGLVLAGLDGRPVATFGD